MKYKVLHIITRWMKSGGAERNTRITVLGLDKEKYEVSLALGSDSEVIPEELEAEGIKIIKIKNLKRNIIPFMDFEALLEIYRGIKKSGYHIIHTHQSKAGFSGRIAAKMAGAPIVVHTVHGPLFHENQNPLAKWFYVSLEKIAALFTDWFVFVGTDLMNYYAKYKIGDRKRYSIIRSWIDLEKFKEASKYDENIIKALKQEVGIIDDSPIVGMVGRIEKSKGWEQALEVAKMVVAENPKTKFLFVGKGKFLPELKEKIIKAELQDSILFPGFREDAENIMAVFDILILSSPKEGLSQILVQGAVMGKPMVCFDVLGAKEMIKDNGFIVSHKDNKTMAEKIIFLLSDLNQAKAIGEKGKALVDNQWEIGEINKKNNQLYNDIIKERIKENNQNT